MRTAGEDDVTCDGDALDSAAAATSITAASQRNRLDWLGPERYAPEFWAIGYRARKFPPDIQAAVLVLSRSNVN
jgi:hypothetical protein